MTSRWWIRWNWVRPALTPVTTSPTTRPPEASIRPTQTTLSTFSSVAQVHTLTGVEGEWISQAEAARRLDCTVRAVLSLAERGVVVLAAPPTVGARRPRTIPSVDAASVRRARLTVERDRAETAARRADKGPGPPPDGQVWLSIAETAVLIGVSRSRVSQWVHAGRLPATRRRRLWWVRRQDAEVMANARRFRERWGRGPVDLGRGAPRSAEG